MRTPNIQCILCNKPLYRRPSEFRMARYFACQNCRDEARRLNPTDKQMEALKLGRVKGKPRPLGISRSETSKAKMSISHKKFYAEHPEVAKERGIKSRGENHYHWKGGISSLNQAIRQMTENRKWLDAVKWRDKRCRLCGSRKELESHHIIPVVMIIEKYNIKSTDDARNVKELWDIENGIAFCRKCHYQLDGRAYED